MRDYCDILEALASSDYYKVRNKCNLLVNDNLFLKMIVKINDPFVFDRFIKMIEYKMDTNILYENRCTYIKEVLLSKDANTLPSKWISEYIIAYFFRDNYYNYMVNLFEMVSYISRVKKNIIDNSHIKIYSEFRGLNNASFEEKIDLFKKYMNSDLVTMFYDDMRNTKDDSYKELVNSSIKIEHDSNVYCKDISKNYGIDVYYLNGEEFYAFVKCFPINRNDLSDHRDYINLNDNRLGHSFSYIGDKNIGTVDYEQKKVVLIYDNIDYNNIMYVHHGDLHAKKMDIQDDYLSEKQNEITLPSKLIADTKNYNEIYITGKIKPKALICYDTITTDDILFAKKYNLSLLLINKSKYKRYESFDEEYEDNTYVI